MRLARIMYKLTVGKKYRPDYMEDSITKYLTLCQAPEFAVRATLFDGLCLKHQGLFTEAATSYIRMTNELSDLRSAMLLEQVRILGCRARGWKLICSFLGCLLLPAGKPCLHP